MLKITSSEAVARRPAGEFTLPALLCFSHLRWDFVYQRPQHLMSRFAQHRRAFYVEEPRFGDWDMGCDVTPREGGVRVVTPRLHRGLSESARVEALRAMIDNLVRVEDVTRFVAWYYTPMALPWTRHLDAHFIVYDCMDELSLFRGAPAEMVEREHELIAMADVVFTGGASLHEAKRTRNPHVHCFPSSVDADHFRQARTQQRDPIDQANIPHPRLGFAGVIDERMDLDLVEGIAAARPEWQLVMLGPVVKIDPAQLPRRANIHYLGAKPYAELPAYMAGWDVALMPFALNEATKYISPTKTPEYLAAGLPVVSTAIRDVVNPYGAAALARIGDTVQDFIGAVEGALAQPADLRRQWLKRIDGFLSTMSWDRTHERMAALIEPPDAASRGAPEAVAISAKRAASTITRLDVALEA
jgi:UDP-galactopyranose mutase